MAHRHLSNQYFVSHVSKSLSQSLSTCYAVGPRKEEEQQPPAGAAQPIAEFWKIHGNEVLGYIENSRKELQRVLQELQGLYASYTTLSGQEQQDMVEVYVAQLGYLLQEMTSFHMRMTNMQELLAESLDMDGLFTNEQNEHLTLIQSAQASYKLLHTVFVKLSEAYVKARENKDTSDVWPTVQESIQQLHNFLLPHS
jgi:hypothetical protein